MGRDEVERLVDELYSPARERPVVAVTTSAATGRPWVDPGALAARLGGRADVVLLETGPATRALSGMLPAKLEVFGGACRIWWPELTPTSEPYDHPLLFARTAQDGARVTEELVEEIEAAAPGIAAPAAPLTGPGAHAAALRDRLDAVEAERAALDQERLRLAQRLRDAEHALRSERDRREGLERRGLGGDPLASEVDFLLAVRLAYARMHGEGERHAHPLGRMRVGPHFLRLAGGLQGVSVEKMVEVCAQVACGIAHGIAGREVHQLHGGVGGAAVRVRPRDGARAWRCSLQDGTASARRLHWWFIPAQGGAVVEFASVGVHDDMSIPE